MVFLYTKQHYQCQDYRPEIMNRLPKIDILGGALGNIDFAQGELELGFKTQDQSVYECTLIDAFPTSINEQYNLMMQLAIQ